MKIIVTDKLAEEGMKILEDSGFEVKRGWDIPKEELPIEIAKYDAVIIRSATKMKGELLEAAKNVKVIGRAGVGLDNVDLKKAKERNIVVRNTPAATSITVAEHAFSLMIAMAHRVAEGTATLKDGKWAKSELKGSELYQKTLGLIGAGKIATEMAKRGIAFGMNVIIYRQKQEDVIFSMFDKEFTIKCVPLEKLLAESDYISLHVPLTDGTKHMLGKEQFNKMKKGARIVDASRGAVINQKDLIEALKNKKVNAAALDVFEAEPLDEVGQELMNLPNVIGTPHLGAQCEEGQERAGIEVAEIVIEELKKL